MHCEWISTLCRERLIVPCNNCNFSNILIQVKRQMFSLFPPPPLFANFFGGGGLQTISVSMLLLCACNIMQNNFWGFCTTPQKYIGLQFMQQIVYLSPINPPPHSNMNFSPLIWFGGRWPGGGGLSCITFCKCPRTAGGCCMHSAGTFCNMQDNYYTCNITHI